MPCGFILILLFVLRKGHLLEHRLGVSFGTDGVNCDPYPMAIHHWVNVAALSMITALC